MKISEISFKIKSASEEEIALHLKECSNSFIPNLDTLVNINEYSEKIYLKSTTIEAWARKKLIGLIAVYLNDVKSHTAYITNVSITKEYFGLGLASQLMERCIQYATHNSFSVIVLEVNNANIPAVRLYQKYGFYVFENRENSFLMKFEFPSK